MEGNGWGISLFDGMNIDISGNCIEGSGGPAVIAGGTSGLRIADNYFETNNAPSFGGPMVLRPESGSEPNVTVQADIVLNGASDLYAAPWPNANSYGSVMPVDNVIVTGNYHACGNECDPTAANCTGGKLNGMPQSGTLIVAAIGVTIEANSLAQITLGGMIPSQHDGPEGPSACRVPNPLVVTGTHGGFFARKVRLGTATGWDSPQGYAYLYDGGSASAQARLFLETWESDGPTTRANFLNASLLSAPTLATGLAPVVPQASVGAMMDGRSIVSLSYDHDESAAMLLAAIPLAEWPSIAGRALFAAVDVRVATSTVQVGLAIDSGDGIWHNSSSGYRQAAGNWSRVSFQCVAKQSGVLRVGLQLSATAAASGADSSSSSSNRVRVEVGAGAIGVVGAGWSRLVAASSLGLPA